MQGIDECQLFEEICRNQQANQFPPKVLQKLKLVNLHLTNQISSIIRQEFNLLQDDEYQSLLELPNESKRWLLLNSIQMFTQIITGKALILGKSKVFWNKRIIELDTQECLLKIQRKDVKREKKKINLQIYQVWKKEKLTVALTMITEKSKVNDSEILLGFETIKDQQFWFDNLNACCWNRQKITISSARNLNYSTQIDSKINLQEAFDRPNQSMIEIKKVIQEEDLFQLSEERKILDIQELKTNSLQEEDITTQLDQINDRKLPVFEQLIEKASFEYFKQDENFDIVYANDETYILKNTQQENHYRLILQLPKVQDDIILFHLFDSQCIKKWNNELIHTEKIVCVHKNLMVVNEIYHPYNRFYYPRQFNLLKYISKQDENNTFIYEKSVESNKNQLGTVTGTIIWGIYGIFTNNKGQVSLFYECQQQNCGYLTQRQNQSLILRRLKQFTNLRNYLKYRQFMNEESESSIIQQSVIKTAEQQQTLESQKSEVFEEDKIEEIIRIKSKIRSQSIIVIDQKERLLGILKDVEDNRHWQNAIHEYDTTFQQNFNDEKMKTDAEGAHFFYKKEWVIDEKRGVLKFIDQNKLDLQKQAFKYLIKKLSENLMSGKGILNVSLPVYIFEKRTNLQRFAYSYGYAPFFLERAANMTDPVEQMKLVVGFGISSILTYLSLEAPFNPILGETYQAWIKGCPIYLEQISHHPPISAILMIGRGYRIYCTQEAQASMGPNSATGRHVGIINVEFTKTGNIIKFKICDFILGGITFGDRIFYLEGQTWFIDTKNNILVDLQMNPNKSSMFGKKKSPMNYYEGGIYRITDQEVNRFSQVGVKKYDGLRKVQGQTEKLADVNGIFHHSVTIDGKEILNINKDFPNYVIPYSSPLASDSTYREDLLTWQMEEIEMANERKDKLENIQRNDKKLRQKFNSKKHR